MECLKQVAGDLGMSLTGLDLYPEHSGDKYLSLPQVVQFLQDWSSLLTKTEGFTDIAKLAASEAVIEKGKKKWRH